ncbi:unnamed protein product [Didymodactylos carnosus]|uniref:Uncharacterized protein n=2 Tax=Didymodactylos carnosus TaxID=1234261 RepID=A0A816BZT3_9BILA|nr:unnamed protein product [Didymodactylos carnosus]CAF4503274.1 unnamed protein product [Didymodactylos carnosus]
MYLKQLYSASQKDRTPKDLQSHLAYMIACSNCDDKYVGKTVRQAFRRFHEDGAPKQQPSQSSQQSTTASGQPRPRRSDRNKNTNKVDYFPKDTIAEEEEDENNTIPIEKKILKSALQKNEFETKHRIDWEDWEIVSKDSHKYRLLVRQSLQIQKLNPSFNRTIASVPLIVYPEGLQATKPTVKMKPVSDRFQVRKE